MYKTKILTILLLFLLSCKSETTSFFANYREKDLYRLPLVPPYQATNLAGFDDRPSDSYAWELRFIYGGDKDVYGFNDSSIAGYPAMVHPTQLNVANGIIYGYNEKGEFDSEIGFVIVPEERIEEVFKNDRTGWESFLKRKGIENIKLIEGWQAFKQFKATRTLPWYNPQKNIYPE